MVTKGDWQVRDVLAMRMAAEGIPVVVQIADRAQFKVLVGDSATVQELDRADDIACGVADDFGVTVTVHV